MNKFFDEATAPQGVANDESNNVFYSKTVRLTSSAICEDSNAYDKLIQRVSSEDGKTSLSKPLYLLRARSS